VRAGGGAADAWRASLVVTLRRVLSIEALLPEQPEWDCGSVEWVRWRMKEATRKVAS